MANILMVSPNKWGRGITNIWAASHSGILKANGHSVKFFDATFYSEWTSNEIKFNTENKMYKQSDYERRVEFLKSDVKFDLQATIDSFKPEIIFAGGVSSHIHGEGEYVLPQYFYELISDLEFEGKLVVGGLQPTALLSDMFIHYPNLDAVLFGDSERTLLNLCNSVRSWETLSSSSQPTEGVIFKGQKEYKVGSILSSLDEIGRYDYSIFEDQVFERAFQGEVKRCIDFEISRGCIYTCSYCVETVIQRLYGFEEFNSKGALKEWPRYLRCKSAKLAFEEFQYAHEKYGIELFRMQDTNFLTINKKVLEELADLFQSSGLNEKIMLYIETRPEGITEKSVQLLKKLGVIGVGMGVELSSQKFREESLNRYAETEKVERAFKILKENGILRTAYNIIGLPETNEEDIEDTIEFNAKINPDNMTVAFYSPYAGTKQAQTAVSLQMADPYELDVDSALRALCKGDIPAERLLYYKKHFVDLVNEKIKNAS